MSIKLIRFQTTEAAPVILPRLVCCSGLVNKDDISLVQSYSVVVR